MSAEGKYLKCISSILDIKGIYAFTFLSIVISAISIAIPYVSGKFIDSLVFKRNIIPVLALLFFFNFASVLLRKIHSIFISKLSKAKHIELQKKYLEKINLYAPYCLEKFPKGELGMKFFRDMQNVAELLKNLYPQFLDISCSVIFSLVLVFYSNLAIGFIFFLMLIVSLFFIFPYVKIFDKLNSICRKTNDSVFNRLFEFFNSFAFLKSISAENFYKKESQAKLSSVAKVAYKKDVYQAIFNFKIRLFLFIGESLILVVSSYLVYCGTIKIGDMIFYQLLFVSAFNSFSAIFNLLPVWAAIKESIVSLTELEFQECEYKALKNLNFKGQIELQDISFRYNENSMPVLNNFSTMIKAGEFVWVKGENGAGKTTLLKILGTYLKVKDGNVLFDGMNCGEISLSSIREKISVVSQDFLIISDTIKNNITLHDKKYSQAEVDEVVNAVGLTSLISKLKNGLEEKIGNSGKKLSGGEMQKIAIARALIRKPKLIIFDEITNHLDALSQSSIAGIIESLRGKATILFVSHKNEINFSFDKTINL
ncbi:MAG: ABC transporter ATP-binding protein [Opitutales bacterium]|nr:ABC transporter ATP-binding protein [Opitutales bacterium]